MASRYSPFRLIKDFLTGDMPRKLSQLEQNVKEKLESDNARSFGPYTLTDVQAASCRALPWQVVRIDPTAAALRVTLPSPRDADAGWIVLKNVSASTNTIYVEPISGTIDFSADLMMRAAYEALILVPDRASDNWLAIRDGTGTGIVPGNPGEVLTTVAGPALDWALIVNANIDAAAAIEVSKLAAGTDGDVLTTVAGVPTWAASSGGGGSWVTRYEPNFLTHSSFTYGSDTSHVVDTVNVWALNTAYATISIGAIGGAGVAIQQTSATASFFNQTPMVYVELPDMEAVAYGNGPWRVQVQYELVVGFSGADNGNEIQMGIASETGSPVMGNACRVKRVAGANVTSGVWTENGTDLLETLTAPVGSNDVATMLFYPPWSGEYAFSQYSGDYNEPAEPQAKLFTLTASPPGVIGFIVNQFGSTNVKGYQVFMGLNTGNGGTTKGTVYFKRLRVQQWVAGY